ncbi:hypothetical protein Dcar01_03691 [Deinococcus carri]|uniref:Uncharacterized protein n=1 Tax=Deinococcus carri TaxID=1211323 RepID=A0ABP9WFA2_9DEIO
MTLITDATRNLNPWNLKEGDRCFQILIDCDTVLYGGQHIKYSGKVSVPEGKADHLEEAATIAFSIAQQDGLRAALMSYCAFYYYDEDEEGWVQFL